MGAVLDCKEEESETQCVPFVAVDVKGLYKEARKKRVHPDAIPTLLTSRYPHVRPKGPRMQECRILAVAVESRHRHPPLRQQVVCHGRF